MKIFGLWSFYAFCAILWGYDPTMSFKDLVIHGYTASLWWFVGSMVVVVFLAANADKIREYMRERGY